MSGCQVYLKVPLIWMTALQHDWTLIFTREKADHSSSLKGGLFGPSPDILDQNQSHGRVHSPSENIQIYPLSQNLGRGYKLHVTSHCKDIEQNSSMEGGMERRKAKMKGSTKMSHRVYCGFSSRPNLPYCRGKSTMPSCGCLVMRVSKQAKN